MPFEAFPLQPDLLINSMAHAIQTFRSSDPLINNGELHEKTCAD